MILLFSALQWSVFILASSIIAPIAVGHAFGLPINEIATLLQRCLFVIGLSSLLQVFWGHKRPIAEGPAGLWWGVFLIFGSLTTTLNLETYSVLQGLEMGLIISGVIFLLMGLFKVIDSVKKIFTPIVTGTYLFLLIAQLSGSFVKGILGIGYLESNIDFRVAIPAILTLIITLFFAKSKYPKLRTFSILYGLIFGWVLFALLKLTKPISSEFDTWFALPQLLPWGLPKWDISIVLTSSITAILLLSNLIASIDVVKKVTEDSEPIDYNRSGLIMGVNQSLAGIFSTIGFVPLSVTAGFIGTTKMKSKLPFILGSALILAIGLVPPVTLFFASLPMPVGYAAIFMAFSNMITMALKEYSSVIHNENKVFIISTSLMVGIGSMFIPAEALQGVPNFLVSLMNNGLILGVLTCIFLEQGFKIKASRNIK